MITSCHCSAPASTRHAHRCEYVKHDDSCMGARLGGRVHCSSMQGVHSMQRERSAAPWQTWLRVCVAPHLAAQTKDPLLLTRCTDFDRSWACALRRHRVHCTRLCAGRSHAMPGRERGLRSMYEGFLEISYIPYMECLSGGTTCRPQLCGRGAAAVDGG